MARGHRLTTRARDLRRNATDAEARLWQRLRNRQLLGAKFRRQVGIDQYIVDFLCAEARLIVEADGGQHGPETDAARTAYLEAQGFRLLRFWNHDILANMEGVLGVIGDALRQPPHPDHLR